MAIQAIKGLAALFLLSLALPAGLPPVGTAPAAAQSNAAESYSQFLNRRTTARFLTQATFGPTWQEINSLTGTSASEWFVAQTQASTNYTLDIIEEYRRRYEQEEDENEFTLEARNYAFWRNAIEGRDQLRQRMAYALSQIIVVSDAPEAFETYPQAVGYVMDIYARNAFGNYRDILEEVTYSPAMGFYLTYLGNQKADPETGRMPDENYARELLQLFTVGLVQLRQTGEPKRNTVGDPVELYTNADITELAKVFTGLDFAEEQDGDDIEDVEPDVWALPMTVNPALHSPEAKSFLGLTIPEGTGARESISMTLDHLMQHPNMGPFVGRQLIQRFTTSAPPPGYVKRVARAFNNGRYYLPDGTEVGAGRKGDMMATLAAVLFDPANRFGRAWRTSGFGKVREPVLRLTNWARAFGADARFPEYDQELGDLSGLNALAQHPYRSRSVFNFYRPGYVPPATLAGSRGMTVPEMQIVNATSIPGYINTIGEFVFRHEADDDYLEELEELFDEFDLEMDEDLARTTMVPDYRRLEWMAMNTKRLLGRLNLQLLYGTMSQATYDTIFHALNADAFEDIEDPEVLEEKVRFAVLMVMTSPDFLVQR